MFKLSYECEFCGKKIQCKQDEVPEKCVCEGVGEYPKYFMRLHSTIKYIVKFTAPRIGEVIYVENKQCHLEVGFSSEIWNPHSDTRTWKEVTNPNELCNNDLVICWDNDYSHNRTIRFYNAINKTVFSYNGRKSGYCYDNYKKVMPWDEHLFFDDIDAVRASLEDCSCTFLV